MSDNPLLNPFKGPNQTPEFDKIKPEHFMPAIEQAIKDGKAAIENIKNNPDEPNFENTVTAFESCDETLDQALNLFYHLLSVMEGDIWPDLAQKIGPISSNYSSDLYMDPDLFARIQSVYDRRKTLNLTTEQATLLENLYVGFTRSGALLDAQDQDKLRSINEQLSTLGPAFSDNVKKSSESFQLWITDQSDLDGLPPSAIAGAEQAAKDAMKDPQETAKGQWLFTLDFPSYLPFAQHSTRRELREKIWRAFSSRAYQGEYDNCETILKIIQLRDERAKLLGYDTHADFVLERRMAEKRQSVQEFLEKLIAAYKPAAQQDLKTLQDFAKNKDGLDDIKPWDVAYYSEKLRQEQYDISDEDVRPYFKLENVLSGAFTHFSKLFGIEFRENNSYSTWNPDVKAYDVFRQGTPASEGPDSEGFVGTLYTDFYPRKGKKPGAWMYNLRSQGLFRGKIERPIIGIVCNFTKPTQDTPSLITHNEVTTLFHEMGHAIHGLLSDVTHPSVSGTSVKWDFVELPSQLQENYCYEKQTLDLFAQHYETGEPIPQDLIDKLRAAKNFMTGWGGLRQVNFAVLDMAWHTALPSTITDVAKFEDQATADTSLFERVGGAASASFSHIFAGGYSAGYYSYKWAEVLDADAFEAFLEHGLYDPKTAQSYQTEILAKGGSNDPAILYRNFRGRDADPDALLRREGLTEAA